MPGRLREFDRFLLDHLLQVPDCGVELGVLAIERSVRQIVHDDVWIDSMPFDQPSAFRAVHAVFRCGCDTLIDQKVVGAQPDLTAPGARANQLAEAETPEALAERLTVAGGELGTQDDDLYPTGELHVPIRRVAAPLAPVHPGLAHQAAENPAVDVAAAVMANVYNETFAVEHGIEIARPFGEIPSAHGAQVYIADPAVAQPVDREPA